MPHTGFATPSSEGEDDSEKLIRINWFAAAKDVPVQLANQLTISTHDGLHYVTLFSIEPPVLIGSDEHIKEQLGGADMITPKCIARIVVTPEFLEKMATTLSKHLQRVRDAQYEESEESDDSANLRESSQSGEAGSRESASA
jgi:hypothetical protein